MKRRTLTKLRKVFAEVIKEAQQNEEFGERLVEALGEKEADLYKKGSTRRQPGVLNPFDVLKQSQRDGLRTSLEELSVERLKDIVAEHGMDPARLAMKWKDRDRLVSHILGFVSARDRKGDAFRAKHGNEAIDENNKTQSKEIRCRTSSGEGDNDG